MFVFELKSLCFVHGIVENVSLFFVLGWNWFLLFKLFMIILLNYFFILYHIHFAIMYSIILVTRYTKNEGFTLFLNTTTIQIWCLLGPGAYPWIAAIGYTSTGFDGPFWSCAGSLVTDQYVVTAAHCLDPRRIQISRPLKVWVSLKEDNLIKGSSRLTLWTF